MFEIRIYKVNNGLFQIKWNNPFYLKLQVLFRNALLNKLSQLISLTLQLSKTNTHCVCLQ